MVSSHTHRSETLFGTMVSELRNPNSAMMLAAAGLDFFIIDMEHGTYDYTDMAALISVARGAGIEPYVRIPEIRRETVLKSLDAGAATLVVPQVEETAQVEQALEYALYPNQGRRGVALRRAHSFYRVTQPIEYMRQANARVVILPQIETQQGLDNVEAIAAVPGVGGMFIGPFDLSVELGKPGEMEAPELMDAYGRIIRAGIDNGIPTAMQVFNPEMAAKMIREGVSICSVSSDINIITDHTAQIIDGIKLQLNH